MGVKIPVVLVARAVTGHVQPNGPSRLLRDSYATPTLRLRVGTKVRGVDELARALCKIGNIGTMVGASKITSGLRSEWCMNQRFQHYILRTGLW